MSKRSRRVTPQQILTLVSGLLATWAVTYWSSSSGAQAPTQTPPVEQPAPATSNPAPPAGLTPLAASSGEGNLLLGNPSAAAKEEDNYLLNRSQYAMSYNRARGGPNWVAWHTDTTDLGKTKRGKFRPDPDLPASWQIFPADYKDSGYDRGHVCPSGDRTISREANNATFYMSNMLPQAAALNQKPWGDLEEFVRSVVKGGKEVYQYAGGIGTKEKIAGGKISVPQECWKVIVVLPVGENDLKRMETEATVLAVLMPNEQSSKVEYSKWRQYYTSVQEIEKRSGLDLLSALPDSVEQKLSEAVTQ